MQRPPEEEVPVGQPYSTPQERIDSRRETELSEAPLHIGVRHQQCYIYYNRDTHECYIFGVWPSPENIIEDSGYRYPLASEGDNVQKAIQNFDNWYAYTSLHGVARGLWGYNDLSRAQAEQVRTYILNKTPEIHFKTEFDYIMGGPDRPKQLPSWNMKGGKRTKIKKRRKKTKKFYSKSKYM